MRRCASGASQNTRSCTATHHVRIYLDRRVIADWPISSGRPGDDTPNGTYLTIEKANPVEMKGPGYDIWVPWSVRFTWSGDYMHDAFWSVGEQGFTNVSHGCVNLSPANAETYYKLAVPGDPVTILENQRGTFAALCLARTTGSLLNGCYGRPHPAAFRRLQDRCWLCGDSRRRLQ